MGCNCESHHRGLQITVLGMVQSASSLEHSSANCTGHLAPSKTVEKDLSLRSCIHAEVLLHTLIDWDIRSFLVLNVDILERLIIILANADTEQIVRLA